MQYVYSSHRKVAEAGSTRISTTEKGRLFSIKKDGSDSLPYIVKKDSILFGCGNGCDIRIYVDGVAEKHCAIIIASNGRAYLLPFHEIQTSLNNSVVDKKVFLKHNDIITVVTRKFRFQYPSVNIYKELCHSNENKSKVKNKKHTNEDKSFISKKLTRNSFPSRSISSERKAKADLEHKRRSLRISDIDSQNKLKNESSPFRRRVTFGPRLSPEEFDKTLPPSSPLRRGSLPNNKELRSMHLASVSNSSKRKKVFQSSKALEKNITASGRITFKVCENSGNDVDNVKTPSCTQRLSFSELVLKSPVDDFLQTPDFEKTINEQTRLKIEKTDLRKIQNIHSFGSPLVRKLNENQKPAKSNDKKISPFQSKISNSSFKTSPFQCSSDNQEIFVQHCTKEEMKLKVNVKDESPPHMKLEIGSKNQCNQNEIEEKCDFRDAIKSLILESDLISELSSDVGGPLRSAADLMSAIKQTILTINVANAYFDYKNIVNDIIHSPKNSSPSLKALSGKNSKSTFNLIQNTQEEQNVKDLVKKNEKFLKLIHKHKPELLSKEIQNLLYDNNGKSVCSINENETRTSKCVSQDFQDLPKEEVIEQKTTRKKKRLLKKNLPNEDSFNSSVEFKRNSGQVKRKRQDVLINLPENEVKKQKVNKHLVLKEKNSVEPNEQETAKSISNCEAYNVSAELKAGDEEVSIVGQTELVSTPLKWNLRSAKKISYKEESFSKKNLDKKKKTPKKKTAEKKSSRKKKPVSEEAAENNKDDDVIILQENLNSKKKTRKRKATEIKSSGKKKVLVIEEASESNEKEDAVVLKGKIKSTPKKVLKKKKESPVKKVTPSQHKTKNKRKS